MQDSNDQQQKHNKKALTAYQSCCGEAAAATAQHSMLVLQLCVHGQAEVVLPAINSEVVNGTHSTHCTFTTYKLRFNSKEPLYTGISMPSL
jgi:hypothetical protein